MEKLEENKRLIARNECQIYNTRTITEVNEKVLSLRSEFNQIINGAGLSNVQGVGQLSKSLNSNQLLYSNHHYQ